MTRPNVVTTIAATCCLVTSACEGDVGLFAERSIVVPALGADAGPPDSEGTDPPPMSGSSPPAGSGGGPATGSPPLRPPSLQPSGSDAGALPPDPDASPAPPPVPRTVVANGPAVELTLLGIEGGEPRLGACPGGVVIGVRTTANPGEEVFGQRLTFIEPICGRALLLPSEGGAPSGTLSITRDDSMVAWAATDDFFGVPNTEIPDARLLWVLQPATVCPEATPVVVGLAGEYDPVAPDVVDTAAIRSVFIECAPLMLAPNGIDVVAGASGRQLISHADSFAADGVEAYRSACEGGAVMTQLKLHAGFWLDGFVLGCSSLRAE